MNANWSAEQRRHLVALGYTLYRPVAAAAPIDASGDARTHATNTPTEVVAIAEPDAAAPAASEGRSLAALLRALLRAADLDPAAVADTQEWLRAQRIPALAQLRNDPAAKRALWPNLRALRRERTKKQ